MQFSEKLVLLREKHCMSQEELAEKLDVSRQTISNWENGKVAIDTNKAIEICRLFDVDMNYLFLDTEKPDELSVSKKTTEMNKPNRHKLLIVCCVAVILVLVTSLIFASICLAQSDDNTASSTITLSARAGLIILIVACILTIALTATILLITLLKR